MKRAAMAVLACTLAVAAAPSAWAQAAATLESDIKKYAVLIRERGMKAD